MTKSSQLGPRHSRRSNCLGIPAITDQSIPSQMRCAGARPGQPPTTVAPHHKEPEPGAQTAAPHSPDEPKCPNHINKLSRLRLAPMHRIDDEDAQDPTAAATKRNRAACQLATSARAACQLSRLSLSVRNPGVEKNDDRGFDTMKCAHSLTLALSPPGGLQER